MSYQSPEEALFGAFIDCAVHEHITTGAAEWKVFIHCQFDEQHMKLNLTLFSSQLFSSDYLVHLTMQVNCLLVAARACGAT